MSGHVSVSASYFGGTLSITEILTAPSAASSALIDYLDNQLDVVLKDTLAFYAAQGITNVSLSETIIFGDPSTFSNGSTLSGLEEFTNVNPVDGSTFVGPISFAATVDPLSVALLVQEPGDITLTGAANTQFASFGDGSNVNYTVTDGVASTIFLGGGADSVTLYTTNTTLNDTIMSAGTDTINAVGNGLVSLTAMAGADDNVIIDSANVTVTAEGNATVGIHWENVAAGGTVDFINGSNVAATVFAGIYNGAANAANVTAFGGTGGGFFIGGQKGGGPGDNLLVGGGPGSVSISGSGVITQVSADSTSGIVTLVGGADGSVLEAQGYTTVSANAMFAGSGAETLIAASTTGANLFQLGLNYPGLGEPQSNGVVSTQGSGSQTFYLGNSAGATLYGSTAAGEFGNTYNFVSDATAGGGTFTIENFASNNAAIYLVDAAGTAAGSASISTFITSPFNSNDVLIGLTDGTQITLKNTSLSDIGVTTTAGGVTEIY